MSTPEQQYRLEGRFRYGVYISKFDGWDYKYPILEPIRLGRITEAWSSTTLPRAINGQWLDVKLVPEQIEGYYSWVQTDDFLLHMHPRGSPHDDKYAYVGRFSYEPESQEFLMGRIEQKHSETIKRFGNHLFNKYVRGIYLREQRLILIRAYFDPLDENGVYHDDKEFDPELDQQKTDRTLEMLIKNNLPPDISVITRVDNEVVRKFDPIHI